MINRNFLPLTLSFLIWSSWLIPVRFLGESAITLSFFTTLFAAFFWGIILFFGRKKRATTNEPKKKNFLGLLLLALFFVFNMLTYLGALKYTDAAVAVLTHYTAPIFVAFIAPFFLKEKITKDKFISLLISILGFIIIFLRKPSISETFWLGAFLGLFSGFFYALIIVTAKKVLQNTDKLDLLFFQNLFGSVLLLFLYKYINFSATLQIYITLFVLTFLYSVVASYFYITSLTKIESTKVAIIGYIEPVGTIFWGWIFFGESITIKTVTGAFLILYSGYRIASTKNGY